VFWWTLTIPQVFADKHRTSTRMQKQLKQRYTPYNWPWWRYASPLFSWTKLL